MKLPVIRLIDLGQDQDFATSMTFAQSLIDSMNVGSARAVVDYIRTTDMALVKHALTTPARMIHIMGHGSKDGGEVRFGALTKYETFDEELCEWIPDDEIDPDRSIELTELATFLHAHHEGIEATAVFADACNSSQGKFTRALRDSLESPIVYIGSKPIVTWSESTVFASILYPLMLRRRGAGTPPAEWITAAAETAIDVYCTVTGKWCPFTVQPLEPSRKAKKAFAEARRGHGIL